MRATWTLYSEKRIEPERICEAVGDAFRIPKEDVKLLTGPIKKAPPARIYVEEYDFLSDSKDFCFDIELCIETALFKPSDLLKDGLEQDGLNLAHKISSALGEPLVGDVKDYTKNDIYYIKCYPDGREERVEWPDDDEE